MSKVELLAPAGDLHRAKVAIDFGADAVFIGGKQFSLRARASNFDLDEIEAAIRYAHQHNAKLYVTVNMIFHDDDLSGIKEYLINLNQIGVDAVIVASLAVAHLSKQCCPNMEVHVSTQLSATNCATLKYFESLNLDRVVLARECDLEDINLISKQAILPIEVFIHGGMCVNLSGRCTLSNYMTHRDANRGGCAQSCRWKYECFDQDNQLVSDSENWFSMSSKDLNAAPYIPDLIKANVSSLKIEGRMKSEYYLATVVGAYRQLIDSIDKQDENDLMEQTIKELNKAENRPTFGGFYGGRPNNAGHLYGVNGAGVTQEFIGTILNYDNINRLATIVVRNHFSIDTWLEVFGPYKQPQKFVVKKIINSEGQLIERANKPMEIVTIELPFEVTNKDYIRKVMP